MEGKTLERQIFRRDTLESSGPTKLKILN